MKKILSGIFLILLVNSVYSQEDDQLLVTEIKQSTVITQPATLKKGFFKLGTSLAFGLADKIFNEDGKKEFVMENGWAKSSTYSLDMMYGLTNRLELSLSVPYERSSYYYSSIYTFPIEESSLTSKFKLKGSGLGDISFGVNYQLIEGSKTKASLVTRLTGTFPTGEKNPTNVNDNWEYDLPTGSGETTLALDLVYRKIAYPYSFSLYGTFKMSLGGEKIIRVGEDPVEFKSGNFIYAGGTFNFLLNDWIAVQNDLFFVYRQADTYEGETAAYGQNSNGLHYMPNISFQFKKFRFVEGVIIPIKGKSITADPQFILVAQYIF